MFFPCAAEGLGVGWGHARSSESLFCLPCVSRGGSRGSPEVDLQELPLIDIMCCSSAYYS